MKLLTTHPFAETGCLGVGLYVTSCNHKIHFNFYRLYRLHSLHITLRATFTVLTPFQTSHRLNPDGTTLRL